MVSNVCKEKCRSIGLAAERIICYTAFFDDNESYRRSIYYDPRYEVKENIITDIIEAASEIQDTVKQINTDDLHFLFSEYGISLLEYCDMIYNAAIQESYSIDKIKRCADAIEAFVIDMIYFDIANDNKYMNIVKGVKENEKKY